MNKKSRKGTKSPAKGKSTHPVFRSLPDGTLIVSGRDLVGTATMSGLTSTGQILYQLAVAFDDGPFAENGVPTLESLPSIGGLPTPSWIAQIARNFQKYAVRKLAFKVVSTASSLTSGGYIQNFLTDPADANQTVGDLVSLAQAYQTAGSEQAVWKSETRKMPVDPDLHLFVRAGDQKALPEDPSQRRFVSAGVYQYIANGASSSTATNFIELEYEFAFMNRIISAAAASESQALVVGFPMTAGGNIDTNESVPVQAVAATNGSLNISPNADNTSAFRVMSSANSLDTLFSSTPVFDNPTWWNSTTNKFALGGNYVVTLNIPVLPADPGDLDGPVKVSLNFDSTTYSDSLPISIVACTITENGVSRNFCRYGQLSTTGSGPNAGTLTNKNTNSILSGSFVFSASAGDPIKLWLTSTSAIALISRSLDLFAGAFYTVKRVSSLTAGRLSSSGSVLSEFNDWFGAEESPVDRRPYASAIPQCIQDPECPIAADFATLARQGNVDGLRTLYNEYAEERYTPLTHYLPRPMAVAPRHARTGAEP